MTSDKTDAGAISVAVASVRRGECFLVGQRKAGDPLAGLAEFPGGKCRPNETLEECVVRECLEETGISIRIIRQRCEATHRYEYGMVHLTFFDCAALDEREPLPPFQWTERKRLAEMEFPAANKQVIDELLSG